MHEIPFVGRHQELCLLNDLLKKSVANLVVIQGRRRIGKSRLVEEFMHHKKSYRFTWLAPVKKQPHNHKETNLQSSLLCKLAFQR